MDTEVRESQQTVQVPAFIEDTKSTHWAIIKASNKLAANPDCGNRSSPDKLGHDGTDRPPFWIAFQRHFGVLGILGVKDFFCLDAEGSSQSQAIVTTQQQGSLFAGLARQPRNPPQ